MTRENITGRAQFRFAAMAAAILWSETPAGAQESAGRWNVDWGAQYCSLFREAGSKVAGFRIIPGTGTGEAVFMGDPSVLDDLDSDDTAAVLLVPTGKRHEGRIAAGNEGGRRVIVMRGVPADFIDSLAQAGEMRLQREEKIDLAMPLPGADKAVAAPRTCIDRVLVEWGIDPEVRSRLREQPKADESRPVITPDDYPMEALRKNVSGTVVVRLSIDNEGRVTECVPVAGSGSADLDSTTCRLLQRRGRFTPAIGADGQPKEAPLITFVRWWVG